jgi:hypothetical protein
MPAARRWSAAGRCATLAVAIAVVAVAVPAQNLQLELGAIEGGDWRAQGVRLALADGGARLEIASFAAFGRRFENVSLACGRFSGVNGAWACADGSLGGPLSGRVDFLWNAAKGRLELEVAPAPGERWRLTQRDARLALELEGAQLARLADWLPGTVKPSAGKVSGTLSRADGALAADLAVSDAAFADASGLIAGENLSGRLRIDAVREAGAWHWRSNIDWRHGAVLVDPLYVADGGHRLDAEGSMRDGVLAIERARLDWKGIGRIDGQARFSTGDNALREWSVDAEALALDGLAALLPAPWLEQHGLAGLVLQGRARLSAAGDGAAVTRAAASLAQAAATAPARGIGVAGVDIEFFHEAGRAHPFRLAFTRAHVRDLAFGPVDAAGEVADGALRLPRLVAPVADAVLTLNDIALSRHAGRWEAAFSGALTPLSMPALTAALGWHPMGGTLSAVLPRMHYAESAGGSTFTVDGALSFKVFDGDATVDRIRIDNPFGRTPRMRADIALTGLDLEAMTGAVKFGTITGRIDMRVEGLEMENWQPLSFRARIATSAGDFRKRISQRAVQNISSIGGAGAGAAIQASFLRFFDSFGYERIALSCRLAAGVCEMGGIDNAGGGYTIVRGGGLPSVNVVGYNRFVGWQEMQDRIRAVIEGNSKMIVQ